MNDKHNNQGGGAQWEGLVGRRGQTGLCYDTLANMDVSLISNAALSPITNPSLSGKFHLLAQACGVPVGAAFRWSTGNEVSGH